jgi:hypothetical protein
MTDRAGTGWGSRMGWIVRLIEMGTGKPARSVDILEFGQPRDFRDIANFGLTLAEAKQLLGGAQQAVAAAQAHDHAVLRPDCSSCGGTCHIKDWRLHQVATLFGAGAVRLPRFRCTGCGHIETGVGWPSHCRSTPELDQLRAHLSALMPYRVAAAVLAHLLPVEVGRNHDTLRRHTLKTGEQLRDAVAVKPAPAAPAITVTLDSTFIRSCRDGERHLEVRVGNAERSDGGRQVFASVTRGATNVATLIRRSLETAGRTAETAVTAFTDGCPGLQSILAEAGITTPPIAEWFHIAMRLRHARQAAGGLSTDAPRRIQARTAIVAEVERLHWRIWNGKAKGAKLALKRIRKVTHAFKGERGHRAKGVPSSRKLWHALLEIDRYLRGQGARLVSYAERYRAGLRVGTSVTEGTANFPVNRRMNKSQQMRWSREGADLLLQVRCAPYNGALCGGFGHLVAATLSSGLPLTKAA